MAAHIDFKVLHMLFNIFRAMYIRPCHFCKMSAAFQAVKIFLPLIKKYIIKILCAV